MRCLKWCVMLEKCGRIELYNHTNNKIEILQRMRVVWAYNYMLLSTHSHDPC